MRDLRMAWMRLGIWGPAGVLAASLVVWGAPVEAAVPADRSTTSTAAAPADRVTTTTAVARKIGGAILEDVGVPEEDDKASRTPKQTQNQRREVLRRQNQTRPARYQRDVELMPPSGPSSPPLPANPAEVGPGPSNSGQTENTPPSNQVVGACNAVATHPTNAAILYAGFTNGGIWKTTNATASSPTWVQQTDSFLSLSIGDIQFDRNDASGETLVAGIARTSSLAGFGGERIGMLRTTDGGANWQLIGAPTLTGKQVVAVAARGPVILAAVSRADSFTFGNIGLFRSTNSGATFTKVSGSSPTTFSNGLPGGGCYDLAEDPADPAVFYTIVRDAGSNNGVYKSTDTGANWTRVSNAAMNAAITNTISAAEVACGPSNAVFVGIVTSGRLSHVFHSADAGANWTAMALPGTTEGSNFYGIHVGGQGSIHFSLTADPVNASVVYIGGDRQPAADENVSPAFPNSIGAVNYTGRLFRGNASLPPASQWTPLTHNGTAGNSAPHADSRDMAFDASGRLIQGDDGGVFVRTNPGNATGNWFSLQGSLRTTEIHDIAYDSVSNRILVGTQDNGTKNQNSSNLWAVISSGDGGDVAVDNVTNAASNQSIRYTSFQDLGGLRRRVFNASGSQVSSTACNLTVLTGPAIVPQFYTPIKLSTVAPTRMLIAASNGLYESLDQGNTVSRVSTAWAGDGLSGVGIDYGGTKNNIPNPGIIYAVDGSNVFVRPSATGSFSTFSIATGGRNLLDVRMDRTNHDTAYAVTDQSVFQTTNQGSSWTNITGDLTSAGKIRCVAFVPTTGGGVVLVGTQTGVYAARASALGTWRRLGSNMPAATYIFDIEYNPQDDVLVAGSLGRGAFKLDSASVAVDTLSSAVNWQLY